MNFKNIFYKKILGFNFINIISGSYNINFVLERNFVKSKWVGKISRKIRYQFVDLNSRALLAFRLSKLVDAGIPTTKIISDKRINFSSQFVQPKDKIDDKVCITKYIGINLEDFLKENQIEKIKNLPQMFENFVFNLWLGNYDKKDSDYVVSLDGLLFSIDNQLLGPGFKENNAIALGAYSRAYDFNSPPDTGCCLARKLIDEIKKNKNIDFSWPMVKKINSLSIDKIRGTFSGLKFFKEGTNESINEEFIEFLLFRRERLEEKINDWIINKYPRKINI